MTGPEHYAEAERLAAKIDKTSLKPEEFWVVHLAQVHATLALAEAYVAGAAVMRPEDRDEWDRATGRLERDR